MGMEKGRAKGGVESEEIFQISKQGQNESFKFNCINNYIEYKKM